MFALAANAFIFYVGFEKSKFITLIRCSFANFISLELRFVVENSREVVTQENWKEKLMTFTDVFAEVRRVEQNFKKFKSIFMSIVFP